MLLLGEGSLDRLGEIDSDESSHKIRFQVLTKGKV
jgi:hypothetical protein